MRLGVGLEDEDTAEGELRSLHAWLLAEPAARRHARPVLGTARSPRAGAQGDVIDLISLAVSSGFAAASLALSIAAWRATRPGRPVVTVERPDGVRVTISDSSPEETRRLLESLTADRTDVRGAGQGDTDAGGDERGEPT
ncbi:effector-associated constant component EACC1 [Streptomyces camponoticapitis]|uniref:effector-associated constant component EACC1 n=1 Tax=Streptomyces camponoticapitis TaxID=1616125 RepID=UPI00166980A5|nr:hypothetical protein [Streptomyces camponoticapitis]